MGRVAVLGAGESGVGAALLARQSGWEVFVSDFGVIKPAFLAELEEGNIDYEAGGHSAEKLVHWPEVVVKSPGIPGHVAIVQRLREAGVKVVSEIEFASWFTEQPIIAVTGSNGKTTTTSLIHHVLTTSGLNASIGGNIGKSFSRVLASGSYDLHVVEVSSFQLDDVERFRPFISVLLNITEDHLDRYENSLRLYAEAKFNIAQAQTPEDHFIYCLDDPVSMELLPEMKIPAHLHGFSYERLSNSESWFEDNYIHVKMDLDTLSYSYERMALKGRHNVYNTMAAAITGKILDLRKSTVRESFSNFRNIEHRLEKVAIVGGVEFINDSKATNVNSVWYALESVERPVVWIAGGVDKGNDYSILHELVEKKVKSIVAIGKDVLKIQQAFSRRVDLIVTTQSMDEAVKLSYHLADKGDAVLLSPACASFDLFEDYEDRGRQFKHFVRAL